MTGEAPNDPGRDPDADGALPFVDALASVWREESAKGSDPEPRVRHLLACRGVPGASSDDAWPLEAQALTDLCLYAIRSLATEGGNAFASFIEAPPAVAEQYQWYRQQRDLQIANRLLAARCLIELRPSLGGVAARPTDRSRVPRTVSVCTWNMNCWNPARRDQKATLLELEPWDVALLQEVGPEQWATLLERGFTGSWAVELAGGPWGRHSHGAAILVRPPWLLTSSNLIPLEDDDRDVPLRARGLWAEVTAPDGELRVASVHTANAADGDAAVVNKMHHFRSLTSFVASSPQPLLVGMDANAWYDRVELQPIDHSDPHADHAIFENVASDCGMRDALIEHLVRNRPDILERRRRLGAESTDGALEVTFQRSRSSHVRVNRMDRILASRQLAPAEVRTLYSDALTVGSDHALVLADLTRADGTTTIE